MPCQPRKARILLRVGKAKVIKREPFTIQLLYGSSGYKQKVSLGIDAGSKHVTFGYITKNRRIEHHIAKTHCADAFCIAGNLEAKRLPYSFLQVQVRRHNRQIHKQKILKGGRRKLNQSAYLVRGFRLFDKVRYAGQECFIFGRRSSGYFDLRKLDGTVVHRSASWKKLQLLCIRKSLLIEKEVNGATHTTEAACLRAAIR